ncbi:MAG: ATP-binding protein [Cyanobacteria bacterium J06634_6]
MIFSSQNQHLIDLVREMRKLPKETEWVEFKVNNSDPQEIGEYISALANAATLSGKPKAYIIWGVEDTTHEIVGTQFSPGAQKKGNEELENWLLRLLEPKINFHFYELTIDEQPVVLLEIASAQRQPVGFSGQEFVRVGSYKQKLKAYPEKERALWRLFDQTPFESDIAIAKTTSERTVQLLDYPAYFDLMSIPLPENRAGILDSLAADDLIRRNDAGTWDITNLGAVLFARQLTQFPTLRRKTVRVIQYRGDSRVQTIKEREINKGYANGFEGLIQYINSFLPSNEIIEQALRRTVPVYPELAVRELVANTLIHQDFSITGTGPMVEIFSNRMEITNPGSPLVATERFLNSPPKSRNETLASLMRRMGICEERGSGIDKVVFQTEMYQLPAPIFEVIEENTRSVLLAPRPLTKMDKQDRIRACYLHSCLRYASSDFMTNATLRKRFGIDSQNSAIASRLIKEALKAGAIKQYDESAGRRFMKYVPFWV